MSENVKKAETESAWDNIYLKATLAIVGFILIIIIMQFIRDPMFAATLNFVPGMQEGLTEGTINFWYIMSDGFVYLEVLIPFAWALMKLERRLRAIYYVVVTGVVCSINAYMKLMYQAPRPFWIPADEYESWGANYPENGKVFAIGCSTEYGNPSAHAMAAGSMFVFFYLDIGDLYSVCSWQRLLVVAVFSFLSFLVCYSRIICGVHSLD